MTDTDIERMAEQAGGQKGGQHELNIPAPVWVFDVEDLSAFAALVRADALEQAAKECERQEVSKKNNACPAAHRGWWPAQVAHRCAAAIRALL